MVYNAFISKGEPCRRGACQVTPDSHQSLWETSIPFVPESR